MIRFTAEQEEFRKTVARFVDAEVVPVADALDERAEFPAGLFKRIGELGDFGLRYPEKYGGGAGDRADHPPLGGEAPRGADRERRSSGKGGEFGGGRVSIKKKEESLRRN